MSRAVVLWTGGKDCALACHEAQLSGHEIVRLVTFAGAEQLRAHPLPMMKEQAQAMGLPHAVIRVTQPYEESYRQAIRVLREVDQVDCLITGDIAPVDGYPNWVRECAQGTGVDVLTPLWETDRETCPRRRFPDRLLVCEATLVHA